MGMPLDAHPTLSKARAMAMFTIAVWRAAQDRIEAFANSDEAAPSTKTTRYRHSTDFWWTFRPQCSRCRLEGGGQVLLHGHDGRGGGPTLPTLLIRFCTASRPVLFSSSSELIVTELFGTGGVRGRDSRRLGATRTSWTGRNAKLLQNAELE